MSLAIAVTATWLVLTAAFVMAGLWTTLFFPGLSHLARIRIALWLGLAQVTVLLIAFNFFAPLGSVTSLWLIAALGLLSLTVWLIRRGWKLARTRTSWKAFWWTLIPIAALLLSVSYLAHAFAGPLTNYDAGLYHINAIQYAAEYPTIPGLANLHSRLGTNTTSTLISAILAATPWGIEAFRLLVGLFVFVFVIDLILRLLDTRQRATTAPGTIFMLLAAAGSIPFMLSEASGVVTSPTSDTISMIFVVVTVAYVIDAFWTRNSAWSTVAAVLAVLAATMRTQLWVFTVLVILVLIVHALRSSQRSRDWRNNRVFIAIGAALIALLGIGMMLRDLILSGWLLFPATLFPMPVDWRVVDPSGGREWILSWAREPGGSPEVVLNSWSWLWPWVTRSATDWAIQLAAGALLSSILIWLVVRFNSTRSKDSASLTTPVGVKGLLVLMIPVIASIGVWFFTAPDPRFAWGPIVALGLIPLTLAITRLAQLFTAPKGSVAITALVASFMTLVIAGPAISNLLQIRGSVTDNFELRTYSFGPITVNANVTPVESATIVEFQLNDGNVILTPIQDDRCHLSFPACRPYPDPTMQFRGDSIEDGFRDGAPSSN